MYHLAGPNTLNRVNERRKDGAVVFDAVPLHMDDDDPERRLLEIDLEFKALVDGDENVKLSLCLNG